MSQTLRSRYQCLLCTKMREIDISVSKHEKLVSNSANGLVLYSDIHRCDEGILAINNAHIDKEYNVRSFSSIELPDKRKPAKKSGLNLPIPKAYINESIRRYSITQMLPKKSLRIMIEDSRLNAIINIGRILPRKEKPIAVAESDQGSIILDYYPSELDYNTNMEKWLNVLVNQMELLPVTRLGLFIETLRFIHGFYRSPPDSFQIIQLQTILSSHETYFKSLTEPSEDGTLGTVGAKYGAELENLANKILNVLKENPKFNLKEVALKLDQDLIYLIYTLLIMDQEGFLEIQRPSIDR
ncbi:MAG: hypothetical protein GPJ54_03750 [Candidatus Heimdallarchaeota archaeon]|nr:hypothetical protein [Candidatus Heimdallarchaeota archaeon]